MRKGEATTDTWRIICVVGGSMVVAGLVARLGRWVGGRFHACTAWLAFVVGVPIVLVVIALVGPILLLAWPIVFIRRVWVYRRFLKKNTGRCYLVWGPRCAWHDFIVNNVLPVLPEGMESVRAYPDRMMAAGFRMALIKSKVWLPPKPFVVSVTCDGIKACTVNDRLQEFKKSQAVDAEVRSRVAGILGEVARQLS